MFIKCKFRFIMVAIMAGSILVSMGGYLFYTSRYSITGQVVFGVGGLTNDTKQVNPSKMPQLFYNVTWYNPPADFTNWPDAFYCGFNSCEFSNCIMRNEREHVNYIDVVLFDGRFLKEHDGVRRKPGQVWVFSAHEAPVSFMDVSKDWTKDPWLSGFNWTMTYDRSNSDIYLPYGEVRLKPNENMTKNFKDLFRNKNKTGLIVHSHCPTRAGREDFVSRLQKHLDLDSFGSCGKPFNCGATYKHDKCFDIVNDYKFYFAFENAMCDQYFTEKLFRNFNYDSIMVVRGGRNNDAKRSLPVGTFISTEDFKSIKALADYLDEISKSEQKYTELLERKNQYHAVPYKVVFQRAMCDLCERMNKQNQYRKQITNIVDWAYGRKPCTAKDKLADLI